MKTKKKKIYIGVVGQIAAGKELFAQYLVEKYQFTTFSLSTILHQQLSQRGINQFNRKTLQDLGDKMRQRYGDDILAKRTIRLLANDKRSVVITGIRNPAEVRYLKRQKNFFLVAIKAKRKIRFQRVLHRAKPWDPKTWSDFYKIDRRDFGIGQEKSGQQVGACIKMADFVLTNNKDKKDFQDKVERLIKRIFSNG